jgi:hypothetical protein
MNRHGVILDRLGKINEHAARIVNHVKAKKKLRFLTPVFGSINWFAMASGLTLAMPL